MIDKNAIKKAIFTVIWFMKIYFKSLAYLWALYFIYELEVDLALANLKEGIVK